MAHNQKRLVLSLGLLMLLALALAPLAMPAAAQGVTVQVADHPQLGKILTDGAGMTLYLFTKDAENVSNCYDQCAVNWPPLLVDSGQAPAAGQGLTGQLGTIERTDGGRQVTYNGIPLYYWINDSNPGDVSGQNVGNVWFVVHPDISSMTINSPMVQVSDNPTWGNILTSQGMTLYLFTNDQENVSNCYDQCAVNWPPLLANGGTPQAGEGLPGTLGLIDRTDGTKQVTYNGIPLYFWIRDVRPGDTNGQEVGNVWYVVSPAGAPVGASASGPAAAAPTAAPAAATPGAQPSTLPTTGGGTPAWAIILVALGGVAVLAAGVGLVVARRSR